MLSFEKKIAGFSAHKFYFGDNTQGKSSLAVLIAATCLMLFWELIIQNIQLEPDVKHKHQIHIDRQLASK